MFLGIYLGDLLHKKITLFNIYLTKQEGPNMVYEALIVGKLIVDPITLGKYSEAKLEYKSTEEFEGKF